VLRLREGEDEKPAPFLRLVAPTAELLPLKAFKSDGTAKLSDILRAIYYAVQQSNANVINMSFDMKTSSTELKNALDYATQLGLTCWGTSFSAPPQTGGSSLDPTHLTAS